MNASQTSAVAVGGRTLELLDLPGSSDDSPLVLLHEGLGSVGLWREFPNLLRDLTGRRVIAYSRAGHGYSDPPPGPRTAEFFHEEALVVLPSVLDQLEVSAPVLIGHSDGASIAVIHAAHHAVSAIALMAPHLFVEEVTRAGIAAARDRYMSGELRQRMARHHDDPDAAFWGWCEVWLSPEFRGWSIESEAAAVSAPTLLIQGRDDPYGSLEQLDRIEGLATGRTERLVLAGGHSPHLEHGREVAEAIGRFLAGVG